MAVYTLIPNQPLGWSSTIPTDSCGCENHDYCAPMLFTLNEYVYDAYVARCVADGAVATDIPADCQALIRDEFYAISGATRYVSDKVSFLYQKTGETETCDNLVPYANGDVLPKVDPETTILTPEDAGYVAGAIGFNTQGGGPEPIPQIIEFPGTEIISPGCENTIGLTIIPDEAQSTPWRIVFSNEYGETYEINSLSPPNTSFSIVFQFRLGSSGFFIDIPADGGTDIFTGIISVRQISVTCVFEPIGFIETEDGDAIGEVINFREGVASTASADYYFTEANIGLNNLGQIKGKCYYIKINSGCCCQEVFYSKCVKPLTDPCHTVGVEFWQNVTSTADAFGFGFYYPAATSGNEYKQFMRVWGEIRNPQYDGEVTTYEDSIGTKSVVYAESREFRSFIVNYSPEYVHNALRLACRHQNFVLTDTNYGINAENFYTRSETYSPSWIRISKLAPVTIEVEKKTQTTIGGSSKTFCS